MTTDEAQGNSVDSGWIGSMGSIGAGASVVEEVDDVVVVDEEVDDVEVDPSTVVDDDSSASEADRVVDDEQAPSTSPATTPRVASRRAPRFARGRRSFKGTAAR